jgi:hypothetical protein
MPQRPYRQHTVFEFLTLNPNIKYLGSTTLSEPNMEYYKRIPVAETRYLGVFQDARDKKVEGRVMPRIMYYLLNTDDYVLNNNIIGLSYFNRDVEKFGDEDTVMDIYERLVEDYRIR